MKTFGRFIRARPFIIMNVVTAIAAVVIIIARYR